MYDNFELSIPAFSEHIKPYMSSEFLQIVFFNCQKKKKLKAKKKSTGDSLQFVAWPVMGVA